MADRKQKYLY